MIINSSRFFKQILHTTLFSDYVSGGELFTHVYQRDHFSEEDSRIYIGEVILALEKLHSVSKANQIRNSNRMSYINLTFELTTNAFFLFLSVGYYLSRYQA